MSLYYRLKKLQGYHFGVLCCAIVAAVVLVINLVFMIWALSKSRVQNGLGTVQDGGCKRTKTVTFWIHLAINVLSTLLLGASNYSMQCLSSPTRSEIDKAHRQGIWLDIGVLSVKNLRRLSTRRIVLWWLLAISSIPLHLLYYSAVFSTLCTRQYNVFLVSPKFIDGAPFNATGLSIEGGPGPVNHLQAYQKNKTSSVKLENKECVEIYLATIISTNSDLILVSDYSSSTNSLVSFETEQESRLVDESFPVWACSSVSSGDNCDLSELVANPQNWSINLDGYSQGAPNAFLAWDPLPIDRTSIQYCLSQRMEEYCKLQFSLVIMIIVIICNLVQTICMGRITWKQDPEPLVTLGDVIASFLDQPKRTTERNCIVGKTRFEGSKSWGPLISKWNPKRLCWFRTVSKTKRLLCNIL